MLSSIKLAIKSILPEKVRGNIRNALAPFQRCFYFLILFFFSNNTFLQKITKYFSMSWLDIRQFDNISNSISSQPHKYEYIFNYSVDLFYSPPRYAGISEQNRDLVKVRGCKKYAAILKNVSIIGGSSVVLLDNQKVLYDLKDFDLQHKYRYTDKAIKYYKNDYCIIGSTPSNVTIDRAIMLSGNYSWNYYHLLFEIMVKFEMIYSMGLDSTIPILVDKVCFKVPQYSELFSLLNSERRVLIPLEPGKRYTVKQLYYFSCPNIIPPNYHKKSIIEARDVLFDLPALQYLRSSLLRYKGDSPFPKRIFVSRSKACKARKYNEKEVFEVLLKYGFQKIYPEEYSIRDQMTLFNNAECIVGGTGAAFSNLLFCQSGCKVIILTNHMLPLAIFSTVANVIGVDLFYLSDDAKKNNKLKNIHDSYAIDKNNLNNIISGMIS